MTSLRDEHLIYPEQNGNKQHWRVAFQLVIRVKGLDLEGMLMTLIKFPSHFSLVSYN